jgi:hypothetical protein
MSAVLFFQQTRLPQAAKNVCCTCTQLVFFKFFFVTFQLFFFYNV